MAGYASLLRTVKPRLRGNYSENRFANYLRNIGAGPRNRSVRVLWPIRKFARQFSWRLIFSTVRGRLSRVRQLPPSTRHLNYRRHCSKTNRTNTHIFDEIFRTCYLSVRSHMTRPSPLPDGKTSSRTTFLGISTNERSAINQFCIKSNSTERSERSLNSNEYKTCVSYCIAEPPCTLYEYMVI